MKTTTDIIPAGDLAALEDQAAGSALTAQYQRAVSGMREVLIFGAMLMQIEESVTVSTRGHGGKFGDKGTGLKGWLEANAPDISRPTALRFLGITKAIAADYQSIVGARVAKKFDLPTLVLTDNADLPEEAQLKQGELFDYVSGTSQRSWLDRFQPRHFIGGDTRKIDPATGERINHERKSLEEAREEQISEAKTTAKHCVVNLYLLTTDKHHRHLNDRELDDLIDAASEALTELKRWRKLTKRERNAEMLSSL